MERQLEVTLFWYDIPKVRGRDIFPNPSNILRRIGVRTNGSDWAIPTHLLPYNLINSMIAAGCNCHMMEFATDTAKRLANLLGIVSDSLDKQVKDSVNSVQAIATDAARFRTNRKRARTGPPVPTVPASTGPSGGPPFTWGITCKPRKTSALPSEWIRQFLKSRFCRR
jgi:hypothetical protein